MSMEYIRRTYGVPAKRGVRVRRYRPDGSQEGTIVGTDGAYIRVRMDGEKRAQNHHPTWAIEYL